jgi:microcystin-dependent protein
MPESTTTLIQLLLMETGGRNNDWGTQANNNFTKIETAIAGRLALVSTGGTAVLTDDEARNSFLDCSGILASNRIIQVPNRAKTWMVRNNHTLGAFALTMKTASGSAITIPAGASVVTCDGSNVLMRIGSEVITNANLAAMPANTVKGNNTGSSATPTDITMAQLITALRAAGLSIVETGTIEEWGGTIASIPAGYLFCNGAAVSRTTYAALFAAIGTTHGVGDGSTTFNLPDKRNLFTIGANSDVSSVPNTNITGSNTKTGGTKDAIVVTHGHTANVSESPHGHATRTSTQSSGGSDANGGIMINNDGASDFGANTGAASTTAGSQIAGATTGLSVTIVEAGSSGTNQNLPPYTTGVFMIKT